MICEKMLRLKRLVSSVEGFSLVELMVVVAVILILGAAGLTYSMAMESAKNMHSDARDLLSNIQTTRLEAVKRNACVAIRLQPVATPIGGSYVTFLDNGAGGGIACNAIQDGSETTMQTIRVRPKVALQMSPVVATGADPQKGNLFTSLSFGQRSLVRARLNAGNGNCVFAHNGNSSPLWLRVVVRSNGAAFLEKNSNLTVENEWSR